MTKPEVILTKLEEIKAASQAALGASRANSTHENRAAAVEASQALSDRNARQTSPFSQGGDVNKNGEP